MTGTRSWLLHDGNSTVAREKVLILREATNATLEHTIRFSMATVFRFHGATREACGVNHVFYQTASHTAVNRRLKI